MVMGEPHLRFYAGVPLSSDDGFNIGTLCIADQKPRDLSEGDLEILSSKKRSPIWSKRPVLATWLCA